MKKYKVVRIIGLLLLVLGVALIILQMMEGGKSVVGTIAAGGAPITLGFALLGLSFRLENKLKASGDPSDTPKG